MVLFLITAIEKYITAQDQKFLKEKWEAYKVHFHDPNIQENIRNAEFLKELKKKKQSCLKHKSTLQIQEHKFRLSVLNG
jgi:hypothetical protein